MPQPTTGDVHVDRPLTNISIAWFQRQEAFVADKVFPPISTKKRSDLYYEYDQGDLYRDDMKPRAPSTESAGSGWNLTTSPYFCNRFALHKDIDDDTRDNADEPLDMDRDASLFLTQKYLIKKEKTFVTDWFTTSLWTGSTTGGDIVPGTLWDVGGSVPITDIRAQIFSILKKTGMKPNVFVMGAEVWEHLQDNADFLARVDHGTPSEPSIVKLNLLAQVLEIDRVLVSEAVENTAIEGATDAFDFIAGKNALVAYSNPSPSLLTASAGYTFNWTGKVGAGQDGFRVKRFRMDPLDSDRIELEAWYDQKLVAANLGAFFSAVVS